MLQRLPPLARQLILCLAAAVAAAIGTLLLVRTGRMRPESPLDAMRLTSLGSAGRSVEGRLSGFPHAPFRKAARGEPAEDQQAAIRLLLASANDRLPKRADRHAEAVALLLSGATVDAIHVFRQEMSQSQGAAFWNDYAVALLARSAELDDPSMAIDAVTASDRALQLDADSAAAHFNRGLAFARLGLLLHAAREWSAASVADPSSAWADEAIGRMRDIPNEAAAWVPSLQRIEAGDAALPQLVRAHPQQARTWGENICLTRWADAVLAGDERGAARLLELAGRTGDALQGWSGESLLRDAVAAIRTASARGEGRELARAYVVYRTGRKAHSRGESVAAERQLREAEALFASAGSPMALVSRYYVGSALYAQTRTAESAEVLDALAGASLEPRGYHALAAQIGWERGLCAMARGSISDAIDIFEQSRSTLGRLGETQLEASMSTLIAAARDSVADRREAWRARSRAFAAFSRLRDTGRFAVALTGAAGHAERSGELSRAQTLFDLAVESARQGTNAALTSSVYARRAALETHTGARDAAELDLREARQWLRAVRDERLRLQNEADIARTEGVLLAERDPLRSLLRFATALAFYERAEYRIEMPKIYLQRARVERSLGRLAEARADLSAGMDILDRERMRLRDLDQRATLFDGAEDLFAEAADLELAAGDAGAAFDVVERERARALLDRFSFGTAAAEHGAASTPLPSSAIRSMLAHDAAIVEYQAVGGRVVAFVLRNDRLRAVTIGREQEVAEAAARLRKTLAEHGDLVPAASAADALFLALLRDDLRGAARIAFAARGELAGVPFAALYDPSVGRFLIETTAVLEAPSATLALTASQRARRSTGANGMLVVGANEIDTAAHRSLAPIPFAKREALEVAATHPESTVLVGLQATRHRVLAAMERSAVVHFAGHAVQPAVGDVDAALLVAPSPPDRAEIRASDIARLHLQRASLVVLAACRSAQHSERSNPKENLALAFLAAGAGTIVASSSDLEDESARRLMIAFHRLAAGGRAPEDALRQVLSSEIRDAGGNVRTTAHWADLRVIGGSIELIIPNAGRRRS